MADIIDTLHPEGRPSDNIYPNIKPNNIPEGAVSYLKLGSDITQKISIVDDSVRINASANSTFIAIVDDDDGGYGYMYVNLRNGGTVFSIDSGDGYAQFGLNLDMDYNDINSVASIHFDGSEIEGINDDSKSLNIFVDNPTVDELNKVNIGVDSTDHGIEIGYGHDSQNNAKDYIILESDGETLIYINGITDRIYIEPSSDSTFEFNDHGFDFETIDNNKLVLDNNGLRFNDNNISTEDVVGAGLVTTANVTFGSSGNYKDLLDLSNLTYGVDYADNGTSNTQFKYNSQLKIKVKKGGSVSIVGYPSYSNYSVTVNRSTTTHTGTYTSATALYDQTIVITGNASDNVNYYVSLTINNFIEKTLTKAIEDIENDTNIIEVEGTFGTLTAEQLEVITTHKNTVILEGNSQIGYTSYQLVGSFSADSSDFQLYSCVYNDNETILLGKLTVNVTTGQYNITTYDVDAEDTDNKVTTLSASSTDIEYPSAKCVYDSIDNIFLTDAEMTTLISEVFD